MATQEAASTRRDFVPLIRWAAFTGIGLLVMRRVTYSLFPGLLPSHAWRPQNWLAGTLATAGFELILLAILLGVPVGIYFWRLRGGPTNGRALLIDCGAAAGLY